jgi:small subunit ribosomal protein S16
MVKLRLARIGRKNIAIFKIVAQDSRCDTFGRVIDILGFYNPRSKQKKIDAEKVKFWLEKGAQLSESLHNLLVEEKIIKAAKRNVYHPKRKSNQASSQEAQSSAK